MVDGGIPSTSKNEVDSSSRRTFRENYISADFLWDIGLNEVLEMFCGAGGICSIKIPIVFEDGGRWRSSKSFDPNGCDDTYRARRTTKGLNKIYYQISLGPRDTKSDAHPEEIRVIVLRNVRNGAVCQNNLQTLNRVQS